MNIPIGKIESAQTYLNTAFSTATKKASEARSTAKGYRINKSKDIELARMDATRKKLTEPLQKVIEGFPSFDALHIFYKELLKIYLDPNQTKKSIASVKWAITKINELHRKYTREIKYIKLFRQVNKKRNEFYGRISSIMERIDKHLRYLESCRKRVKDFPQIKTALVTGSIVGFPNVGKTTLLSKITKAKPEIADYPFTTRRLNLGYAETKYGKIQLIDTPGTLNRFEKMNDIEKLAHLAMKYVSHFYICVIDLTLSNPIEDQITLLEMLGSEYERDIVVYFSKSDLLENNEINNFVQNFKSKNKVVMKAVKNGVATAEDLMKEIERLSKEV